MTGSQLSGMLTASSTAAPKDMVSVAVAPGLPPRKMTTQSTTVSTKSRAMVILLSRPRFVMPMAIHMIISTPMTMLQTQMPTSKMPLVATAPS